MVQDSKEARLWSTTRKGRWQPDPKDLTIPDITQCITQRLQTLGASEVVVKEQAFEPDNLGSSQISDIKRTEFRYQLK